MINKTLKILFLADTHLGFDLPMRPRIEQRRRGLDFFKNYHLALQPAFNREVDFVVHGGDLFFRSRVHPKIVGDAFKPLLQIADLGLPVYIVPGNHERSKIPRSLLESHRLIHIFDKSRTFYFKTEDKTVALAGFPYYKNGIRRDFKRVLEWTDVESKKTDVRILCMHHIVEGAQVGIQNFTFRQGDDVIEGKDIPAEFDVILSGHIHRCQVLTKDLSGRPLVAPVLYPGAIERTSFVERAENKGYFIVEVGFIQNTILPEIKWTFHELPTRPMYVIELAYRGLDLKSLKSLLNAKLAELEHDSVVKVKLNGLLASDKHKLITNKFLRSIAPATMNIDLSVPGCIIQVQSNSYLANTIFFVTCIFRLLQN